MKPIGYSYTHTYPHFSLLSYRYGDASQIPYIDYALYIQCRLCEGHIERGLCKASGGFAHTIGGWRGLSGFVQTYMHTYAHFIFFLGALHVLGMGIKHQFFLG